jgi:glycosyltransferase involved in cell wall biosynthesis
MISRVCRFVAEYPTAGQSTYGLQPVFVNLSEEQVRMGYEVHVIARQAPGQPTSETINGVRVHRVRSPFNVTALFLSLRLTHGEKGWVLHPHATSGIFLNLVRKLSPTPLVCHSHGTSRSHNVPFAIDNGIVKVNSSPSELGFHTLREKFLWSGADRLLVVSRAVMQDVTRFYGVEPGRIRVVYNGVDTNMFCPSDGSPLPLQIRNLEGKRIILFVGHFGLRKGIFFLIRAMQSVRSEFSDAHLVCVGGTPQWLGRNDYEKLLRDEIQRNGVEDCVTLLDAVRHSELIEFYRHSEVFVLPTYYEAFPKVVVEAMACSKPVLATRTGGIPELVKDGETGLLVPFGSPEAIAKKLGLLLGDGNMSASMGKRGRERVESNFTWRAVAERTKSAYDELISN